MRAVADDSVLAAIDIGTNSFHLVVARAGRHRFDVITSEKEVVRLGAGSGDMKRLRADAVDRGVAALRRLRIVAESSGASVRAVATSAVREASNRNDFLRRARDEAGVDVEVVSGPEEARLIHLGVLQALPLYDRRHLVVDIGGGSTEFVVGHGPEIRFVRSLKLGAIRLTDRFFPGGTTTPARVVACRDYLRSYLAPMAAEARAAGFDIAVGSSGTVQNLAEIAVLAGGGTPPRSPNGLILGRDALDEVVTELVDARTPAARSSIDGVDPKRADILAAGALLLEAIFESLDLDECTVSGYALREGVLLDTLAERRRGRRAREGHLSDLRRSGVEHLLQRFDPDGADHAHQVARLAVQLFRETAALHALDERHLDTLEAAALLCNVGRFVSHESHHQHSYYVIRNSEHLTGFTEAEVERIALVARYHRKSAPKPRSHPEFAALGPDDRQAVRVLAGLLRIAIGLDRGQAGRITAVRVRLDEPGRHLTVLAETDDPAIAELEAYTAQARRELAEDALGHTIDIELVTPRRRRVSPRNG